jgi:hypothetical protein
MFFLSMTGRAAAQSGPPPKVGVCHVDETGAFKRISIAATAVSAHLAHGDGLPGGIVPGNPGWIFDAQCGFVQPPPPPPFVRVFVTRDAFDGNLGGLSGADASCHAQAELDGSIVGGGLSWKAFLSDSTQTATSRLAHPAGTQYRLADGVTVAASDDTDFFSDVHLTGIDQDQFGNTVGIAEVWTGANSTDTCDDWTYNGSVAPFGRVGLASASDATWANIYAQFCNRTNVRLYCVQQ